jgi:hypothetical protein
MMLDIRRHWEANVLSLSAPAVWYQAGQPYSLRAGYSVPRDTDQAVANALGVGVRMITIRARDTAGRSPRTLDRLTIAGEELTIDAVTPVIHQGVLIGWRCTAAGQGVGP